MTDLTQLTATRLSTLIEARDISPVEVMTACLDRIEAANPALNAIVSLRPREELLAEARAAESAPRRGWLHGIPIAVKDLAQVAGLRTTWGSPLFADFVAEQDDLVPARMRAAGAIFVGKTNTPEWGLGSHSFNPVFGVTGNPYDPALSAGGSSGGAAAALAARMQWVCDGSDMMGSLRNPAAFCNVYGFRPSWGLVPGEALGDGFMATMATSGPMARNVEDLARLLQTIAGPNPDMPFDRPNQPFADMLDRPVKGLRIGWLGDWGGAYPCEPGIQQICRAALDQMQDLGAEIVDLPAPFPADRLWDAWVTIRSVLNAGAKRRLYDDPTRRAQLSPEAIWEIETGRQVTTDRLYAASEQRSAWYRRLAGLFGQVDLIALPSAQVWPFDKTLRRPVTAGGRALDTYHRWMEVVVPVSLAGLPCLSVPVGFGAAGLPMGMQLAGPVGADALVLAMGQAWDRATGWPQNMPPAI
ncbi:amidase [Paracoccus sp. M683]|uniref:amidase n=1 Tax=Paracoccus sp. M683 TaxID=2594268 RepID=UPI00117DC5B5|nr:amidase [Paracoccus sp. M683]TRW97753.1 amidase [Paracoccus sp. M683]